MVIAAETSAICLAWRVRHQKKGLAAMGFAEMSRSIRILTMNADSIAMVRERVPKLAMASLAAQISIAHRVFASMAYVVTMRAPAFAMPATYPVLSVPVPPRVLERAQGRLVYPLRLIPQSPPRRERAGF